MRLYLRGVHHGAYAREHGAAEHGGNVPRQVRSDTHQRLRRHDGVVREAGNAQMMVQGKATVAPAAFTGEQGTRAVYGEPRLAEGRAVRYAGPAVAAGGHERGDYMVAHREPFYACAQRYDDASRLVAEHHGHGSGAVAVHHRKVGMAQTGGFQAHQHLAAARRGELHFDDVQRAAGRVGRGRTNGAQDGCFDTHGGSLPCVC